MKTIKDAFVQFKTGLEGVYDSQETEAITLLAINVISGLSKAKIKAFPELELTAKQFEKLAGVLNELTTGKPVQYILGTTEFYGLPFKVNPSVLIPRPETEELVGWAIEVAGTRQFAEKSILDIGTGSGCIAISLKKILPTFNVSAIDISKPALKIAKENADLNQVAVEFIEGDILNYQTNSPFSLIVSNPPYVTLHDKTQMHQNVTDFEPHSALFVPEDDPLAFYKAIADFAAVSLTQEGLLFFEINESYGQRIIDLLEYKLFTDIELRKDMSGRDRMIKASFKK